MPPMENVPQELKEDKPACSPSNHVRKDTPTPKKKPWSRFFPKPPAAEPTTNLKDAKSDSMIFAEPHGNNNNNNNNNEDGSKKSALSPRAMFATIRDKACSRTTPNLAPINSGSAQTTPKDLESRNSLNAKSSNNSTNNSTTTFQFKTNNGQPRLKRKKRISVTQQGKMFYLDNDDDTSEVSDMSKHNPPTPTPPPPSTSSPMLQQRPMKYTKSANQLFNTSSNNHNHRSRETATAPKRMSMFTRYQRSAMNSNTSPHSQRGGGGGGGGDLQIYQSIFSETQNRRFRRRRHDNNAQVR